MRYALFIVPSFVQIAPFLAVSKHSFGLSCFHLSVLFFFSWQQGEQWIPEARLNPTQMLNYEFYSNPHHWSNGRRNAILHRWGGLGNHRYQVGFSGDVEPSWTALALSDIPSGITMHAREGNAPLHFCA
jgi:hypothetical protein